MEGRALGLAFLSDLPSAKVLLADKGYDADWFREAPDDKGITPCIPARQEEPRNSR